MVCKRGARRNVLLLLVSADVYALVVFVIIFLAFDKDVRPSNIHVEREE
jgi:hypothetical protein